MASTVARPLADRRRLPELLAEDLMRRLERGEWQPGARLPSEAEIGEQYGLSRATVRSALHTLQANGYLDIRQGAGTFATPFGPAIRTGLQNLESITETIRRQGHRSDMVYRSAVRRAATPDELRRLRRPPDEEVFGLERAIISDDAVIAFCYDAIPTAALPASARASEFTGSTFAVLERYGQVPQQAIAEVHAVSSDDVGWPPYAAGPELYILLDQVHVTAEGEPVMYSRTYFVEGRFRFTILRRR